MPSISIHCVRGVQAAVVMLVTAFVLLLLINLLQAWARRRQGR